MNPRIPELYDLEAMAQFFDQHPDYVPVYERDANGVTILLVGVVQVPAWIKTDALPGPPEWYR